MKEQTRMKYKESKKQRFDFETEKRPSNFEKIKKEIEEKRAKELDFDWVQKFVATGKHRAPDLSH